MWGAYGCGDYVRVFCMGLYVYVCEDVRAHTCVCVCVCVV